MFFAFNVWQFIMVYFCVGLLKFLSFATFWTSWLWMSIPFPKLDKFTAISSSHKISVPFLSSPGTSVRGMWVSLMLSCGFTLFRFLSCSDGVSSTALLQVNWFLPPASSSLLLNPLGYFLVNLFCSAAPWLLFGTFLHFLFAEVLSLFIQCSPKSIEHLYNHDIQHFIQEITYLHFIMFFFSWFYFALLCSTLVSVY